MAFGDFNLILFDGKISPESTRSPTPPTPPPKDVEGDYPTKFHPTTDSNEIHPMPKPTVLDIFDDLARTNPSRNMAKSIKTRKEKEEDDDEIEREEREAFEGVSAYLQRVHLEAEQQAKAREHEKRKSVMTAMEFLFASPSFDDPKAAKARANSTKKATPKKNFSKLRDGLFPIREDFKVKDGLSPIHEELKHKGGFLSIYEESKFTSGHEKKKLAVKPLPVPKPTLMNDDPAKTTTNPSLIITKNQNCLRILNNRLKDTDDLLSSLQEIITSWTPLITQERHLNDKRLLDDFIAINQAKLEAYTRHRTDMLQILGTSKRLQEECKVLAEQTELLKTEVEHYGGDGELRKGKGRELGARKKLLEDEFEELEEKNGKAERAIGGPKKTEGKVWW